MTQEFNVYDSSTMFENVTQLDSNSFDWDLSFDIDKAVTVTISEDPEKLTVSNN